VVFNPWKANGGLTDDQIKNAKVILWRGHCSVHGRFSIQNINDIRAKLSGVKVLVHPECQHEVVSNADVVGSTEMIIKTVEQSPAGSKWAIGTELNLVQRLANENLDKQIVFLDKTVCYCSTMNRIDLPHLVWAMESLVSGQVVNQIKVKTEVATYAKVALERMLALP
jgi:quinolinate synthase